MKTIAPYCPTCNYLYTVEVDSDGTILLIKCIRCAIMLKVKDKDIKAHLVQELQRLGANFEDLGDDPYDIKKIMRGETPPFG